MKNPASTIVICCAMCLTLSSAAPAQEIEEFSELFNELAEIARLSRNTSNSEQDTSSNSEMNSRCLYTYSNCLSQCSAIPLHSGVASTFEAKRTCEVSCEVSKNSCVRL